MTEYLNNYSLEGLLSAHARQPHEWQPPVQFDLSRNQDRRDLQDLFEAGEVKSVYDPIDLIADDLYELNHPDKMDDDIGRVKFVTDIREQGNEYGNWFLFPWSGELGRFAEKEQHRAVKTIRNRGPRTAEEQQKGYDARIVVLGLSVGSNVLENLVTSGVGGTLITGDPDKISPSNLNRIHGPFSSVGVSKIDHNAMKVSEIDPYIEQIHMREGATSESLRTLVGLNPDIIFDEIDNLPMKAVIRKFAQEQEIPLLMATDVGRTSIVDVERYDLPGTQPFNGRLSADEFDRLADGKITPQERGAFMIKIVGMENIDSRMMNAFGQVGKTLPGMPQLGTTAAKGGARGAEIAWDVISGNDVASGRYF